MFARIDWTGYDREMATKTKTKTASVKAAHLADNLKGLLILAGLEPKAAPLNVKTGVSIANCHKLLAGQHAQPGTLSMLASGFGVEDAKSLLAADFLSKWSPPNSADAQFKAVYAEATEAMSATPADDLRRLEAIHRHGRHGSLISLMLILAEKAAAQDKR